jgi:eukaryotic-like serine/threonine-protein kinase
VTVALELDTKTANKSFDDSQRDSVFANPDAQKTIATKVEACGVPPLKSLYPVVGDSLLHFHIVGELGSGAFSRVFLATQRDLAGRFVALKVSECEDGEPQRLARLQHTNIVPIYSVHHYFQFQVVCMPYVGAHTLATVLKHQRLFASGTGRQLVDTLLNKLPSAPTTPASDDKAPPKPVSPAPDAALTPNLELLTRLSLVDAVLWIAARLADGLAHAHERGILHCDLKPQNVLLSDDGQPMLLDFNVAMDTRSSVNQASHFGGTVPYMAPEHIAAIIASQQSASTPLNKEATTRVHGAASETPHSTPIDCRSDLYSLGVILFQILTNHDPHDLATSGPPETLTKLLEVRRRLPEKPSHWNPSISPAVDSIVLKLLAPDPANRYACAADLREDLERQLANRPLAHAPNTSIGELARKWRRRNPRVAMAVSVIVAGLMLFGIPSIAVAVRQDQIAKRQRELQSAEAQMHRMATLDKVHTAQILLSTQNGDRKLLDQGFALGHEALAAYDIDRDPDWQKAPLFQILSKDQQAELRREFGEMMLLLARCEMLRSPTGDEAAVRAAAEWNRTAEGVFPTDQRPQWLARQRAELLALAPGIASPLQSEFHSDVDFYHDGLQDALRGRYGEALGKLVPFTHHHPDHFMAWYVRGICHDGAGQRADAAAAFTVCAAIKPQMPWPYFSRGLVELQQQRFEAAQEDFTEVLRLVPNWTSALVNRAIARQGQRDWTGAEGDLTNAMSRADAPKRLFFLRSSVRRSAGDAQGAEADAAEGFRQTPTDAVSWVTRGVWRMDRSPKEALADFDAALNLNPRSRDALQNKAVVLADFLNRPAAAAAVMDQLLEMYPAYTEATAGHGVYLARAGDGKGARRDAAICLRDEPTAYRYYQMAGLYAQLARHEADGQARAEAFRLLALALRTGFADLALMHKDSDLDPIRNSDEFRTLMDHARGLQQK